MRVKSVLPALQRKASTIGISADPCVCIKMPNGELHGIRDITDNGHCIILHAGEGKCG